MYMVLLDLLNRATMFDISRLRCKSLILRHTDSLNYVDLTYIPDTTEEEQSHFLSVLRHGNMNFPVISCRDLSAKS